jgi:hypothetical protein
MAKIDETRSSEDKRISSQVVMRSWTFTDQGIQLDTSHGPIELQHEFLVDAVVREHPMTKEVIPLVGYNIPNNPARILIGPLKVFSWLRDKGDQGVILRVEDARDAWTDMEITSEEALKQMINIDKLQTATSTNKRSDERPEYYNNSGAEKDLWDYFFEDDPEEAEAFCIKSAIKYLWRYKKKAKDKDLRKAITYIEKVLKERYSAKEE